MRSLIFGGMILLLVGFFGFWLSSIFFGLLTLGVFLIIFSFMMSRESKSQTQISNKLPSTQLFQSYCPSCGTKVALNTAKCPSCGIILRKER